MKKVFMMAVAIWMVTVSGFAEQDFAKTEIKSEHVSGSIYMVTGEGGNIGVSSGEDGVLMVDDQFAPLYDKIQEAIDEINKGSVKFLLNTHWHGDHTGGNEKLGNDGATIIAHENVRERLTSEQFIALFNMKNEVQPKSALPVITFDQSVTVRFNDERVDVIHLPAGHTDGDSVVFFRGSNVVHAGDYFFNGFYPFIDLKTGGDAQGYIDNVEALLEQIPDDARIIPGHGPLASKEDFKNFHAMLKETTDIVTKSIADGKTLEQVQASSLPEHLVKEWGDGFISTDAWLEILYESYSR